MRRLFSSRALVAGLAAMVALGAFGADAEARKRRRKDRHSNMPKGWTWPPNRAMKDAGQTCLRRLDGLGVVWKKASATRKVGTAVVVPAMELGGLRLVSVFRKPPFV